MAKLSAEALRTLIDEYGDLQQKAAAWQPEVNPHLQRLEEVEAQLLELQAGKPADKRIVLEGRRWKVPVSACRNKSKLIAAKLPALFKRLGTAWVQANCTPDLAAVRAAIPKGERKQFISESRSSVRTIGTPALKEV